MALDVGNSFFKPFRTYSEIACQHKHISACAQESLTCEAEVPEGLFVAFQMIVDAEPLVKFVQRTEFPEERKILSRVLII